MPVVVFNPLNWTRDDVVSAHVSLYGDASPGDIGDYRMGVRLVDESGASVPFHIEQASGTVSRALEMVFVARGVPSIGHKTYFVVPAEEPDTFANAAEIKPDADAARPKRQLGADQIESEFYRVGIDRATGAVTIFDKELNRVVAKDMEIVGSEERGGDTLSKEYVTGRKVINTVGRIEFEENNPVRTVVRIPGDLGGIPVVQRIFLFRGLKRVELENTVDWNGKKLIKIEQTFPYEHPDAEIEYGIPFGAVSGADFMPNSEPRAGDEIAKVFWKEWRQIHDWVFAGTKDWGLTIGRRPPGGDVVARRDPGRNAAGLLLGGRDHAAWAAFPAAVASGGQVCLSLFAVVRGGRLARRKILSLRHGVEQRAHSRQPGRRSFSEEFARISVFLFARRWQSDCGRVEEGRGWRCACASDLRHRRRTGPDRTQSSGTHTPLARSKSGGRERGRG
jgi:hypothetical protein